MMPSSASGSPIRCMMPPIENGTATASEKSNTSFRSEICSTMRPARFANQGSSSANAAGVNHDCVSARYAPWSGSSICSSPRSTWGLPRILCSRCSTACFARKLRGSAENGALRRSTAVTSACRVISQKGCIPGVSNPVNGSLRPQPPECSLKVFSSAWPWGEMTNRAASCIPSFGWGSSACSIGAWRNVASAGLATSSRTGLDALCTSCRIRAGITEGGGAPCLSDCSH